MSNNPLDNLRKWYDVSEEQPDEIRQDIDVKVVIRWAPEKIRPLFIIVEMYDRKDFGKGKREFVKEFTKEEAKLLKRVYGKLYDWYLRKGIPVDGAELSLVEYQVAKKAAYFFSGLS